MWAWLLLIAYQSNRSRRPTVADILVTVRPMIYRYDVNECGSSLVQLASADKWTLRLARICSASLGVSDTKQADDFVLHRTESIYHKQCSYTKTFTGFEKRQKRRPIVCCIAPPFDMRHCVHLLELLTWYYFQTAITTWPLPSWHKRYCLHLLELLTTAHNSGDTTWSWPHPWHKRGFDSIQNIYQLWIADLSKLALQRRLFTQVLEHMENSPCHLFICNTRADLKCIPHLSLGLGHCYEPLALHWIFAIKNVHIRTPHASIHRPCS